MNATDHPQPYRERAARVEAALSLRASDRVPFVYTSSFWSAHLAGITFQEAMYDMGKYLAATRQAVELLQPDAFSAISFPLGEALEGIDYKPMKWPGHGADPNVTFQYLDQEMMSAAEYDEYLLDPTGFYLRKYLPRLAGNFKVLELLPQFATLPEWDLIGAVSAFANPELQAGLKRLFEVGERTAHAHQQIGAFVREMNAAGYPLATGAFCKAPFDLFVDFLRGSKGGILDMFRHQDKLLAAMEKARILLLRSVDAATQRSGCRYVFIPLHWGLDSFMSPKQFETFYWPELRKTMLGLIEKGLVPCVFWEGNCTSRLEVMADVPPGKVIYRFEATDIFRAKEVLGGIACLRGNVPASLLNTGTPAEVDAYCRRLIEQVGRDGGFILDGAVGVPDEAKVENVIAMAHSVRKYAN
jgi:uroporphyrinogen-III decarboxylase